MQEVVPKVCNGLMVLYMYCIKLSLVIQTPRGSNNRGWTVSRAENYTCTIGIVDTALLVHTL